MAAATLRLVASPDRADSGGGARGGCTDFADFFGQVTQEVISGVPEGRSSRARQDREQDGLRVRIHEVWSASRQRLGGFVSTGFVRVTAGCDGRTLRQYFRYSCSQTQLGAPVDAEAEAEALAAGTRATVQRCGLELQVPRPLAGSLDVGGLAHVLSAWASSAVKSFAAAAAAAPPLAAVLGRLAGQAAAGAPLPLKVSAVGGGISSFFGQEALQSELATHVGLFSLTSAVMFIGSIRGLNKHATAQEGNIMGILATALGIISVVASPGFHGLDRFVVTFLLAGALGAGVAVNVQMEDMPQLVAGFHSFVGLAAVSAGFASFFDPGAHFMALRAIETFAGTAIGALTFTGSVVAAGKLHGTIPGAPIILPSRWTLNFLGAAGSLVLGLLFTTPSIYASSAGTACLLLNTAIWGFLGTNMVLPIGGADMPVVVSLLNAFSGLATSAAGFMLSNQLLTITGALVASSGTLLSDIMCRGINRSMYNVLLGGFGTDGGLAVGRDGGAAGPVNEVSAMGFVDLLVSAKRVVIVPGYGLAVARCQQRLAEIVALLRQHKVQVHFAIHPVAGRLPGHMNVLLAEADVPYDIVREMEDVNREMPQYDVAIVVGANDIVNPATQTDPGSPIYGMPAVEVWRCKTCVVLKRSMGTGYSGVDNPLFYLENVRMFFGDARQSMDTVFHLLQESQERLRSLGEATPDARGRRETVREVREDYPIASKVVGIIRERGAGERRVSVTPGAVPKLRRMGFSVLFEAGAGVAAGFSDEDYLREGGVQVAESAVEVLQQADVILKVTAPMLDEVQVLRKTQTMVGFWNMYGTQDLMEALGQSQGSFINLALIPRISRAQKLDALTSMANIAGYRAVIDAFNRLPRFSRSSVTACGAVPPSKVLVIGAGVAGLSAIATAHSLGAKVYANDVREAAREQVESMGAEFVPVDAEGVAGEGVGGYASEMGQAFKEAQLRTYARLVPDMDVVVSTAMIPNRQAPVVITEEMLRSMRRGSVVVDLAAQTGGNCAATERDKAVVTSGGVTVVGETNYPASMPAQASEMLGNNFVALLETLGGATDFGGAHWDDPVISQATVTREGQVVWPPTPLPAAAPAAPVAGPEAEAARLPVEASPAVPESASRVIAWLTEHKAEIALGVGAATVLGLGLATNIPEAELTHIGYFVLSCLIGHFTVAGVTPALHTPLISVTNAISGIIVVGGMLQLSGPLVSARVACALAAVFLSSVNIVGGFAVTHRMLQMFKQDSRR